MASFATPIVTRHEVPDREPAPQQQQQAAPKGPSAEERIAALEREASEAREAAKVWEGIANSRGHAPAPAREAKTQQVETDDIDWGEDKDPDAEPEDVTAEALLDDLSKTGLQALKKHGFVRRSDVVKIAREESRKAAATASKQVVTRARQEVTTESQIMQEFPELADPRSEFFEIASQHVRDAVKLDPSAAKNPTTLFLAAKAARAQLGAKKPARGAARQETDDDEVDDDVREPRRAAAPRRDENHDARVRAQQGDRSRTRSRIETAEPDDAELNDDQRMVADALGVAHADYKKELARVRPNGPHRRRA